MGKIDLFANFVKRIYLVSISVGVGSTLFDNITIAKLIYFLYHHTVTSKLVLPQDLHKIICYARVGRAYMVGRIFIVLARRDL